MFRKRQGAWRYWLLLFALSTASLLQVSWHWSRNDSPNVLLITLDTVRPDHTGIYGYHERDTTPNLDRFVRGARVFDNALTSVPYTAPTHFSFLTGLTVLEHGVLVNAHGPLHPIPVVAEEFRRRGYATAAVVSSYVLNHRFGLNQGFDVYDDTFVRSARGPSEWWLKRFGVSKVERDGAETVARALEWISGHQDRPWFLWVHLFDAHEPYTAPAPFNQAFLSTAADKPGGQPESEVLKYDQGILYVDSLAARLLAAASGSRRDHYEVVVSDHGQGLSQHGEDFHGDRLYDQTTKILLLMKGPNVPPGRDSRFVGPSGVGKALFALAKGESWSAVNRALPLDPKDPNGAAQVMLGRRRLPSGEIWDTTLGPVTATTRGYAGLQRGPWRFISQTEFDESGLARLQAETFELYNAAADPGEVDNLASSEPVRVRDSARALLAALSAHRPILTLRAIPFDIERVRSLKALGYLE